MEAFNLKRMPSQAISKKLEQRKSLFSLKQEKELDLKIILPGSCHIENEDEIPKEILEKKKFFAKKLTQHYMKSHKRMTKSYRSNVVESESSDDPDIMKK